MKIIAITEQHLNMLMRGQLVLGIGYGVLTCVALFCGTMAYLTTTGII